MSAPHPSITDSHISHRVIPLLHPTRHRPVSTISLSATPPQAPQHQVYQIAVHDHQPHSTPINALITVCPNTPRLEDNHGVLIVIPARQQSYPYPPRRSSRPSPDHRFLLTTTPSKHSLQQTVRRNRQHVHIPQQLGARLVLARQPRDRPPQQR